MDLGLGPIALDEVVHEVVQIISPLVLARKQKVLLQIPRGMPSVEADRRRLVHIRENPLRNADFYSPAGQPTSIIVERRDQYAVVSV